MTPLEDLLNPLNLVTNRVDLSGYGEGQHCFDQEIKTLSHTYKVEFDYIIKHNNNGFDPMSDNFESNDNHSIEEFILSWYNGEEFEDLEITPKQRSRVIELATRFV
tara:strand:- start:51 stop:368 length:318 start_codon:yes stop_codon:yes gene_type:complete